MSQSWNDRDLTEWAKKTLPEFVLKACLDPRDKEKIYAKTPWQGYEVTIDECQIEGEVSLTGKKGKDYFAYDLDLGMRVRIQKNIGVDENGEELANMWLGILNCLHFDNHNQKPECLLRLEKCEEEVKQEVEWYFKEGMGKRFVWHALARWNAYSVRKWMKLDPGPIEEPYDDPDPPPTFPPFKEEERKAYEEAIKRQIIESAEPSDEELAEMAKAAQFQDLSSGEQLMARGLAKDVSRGNKELLALPADNKVPSKGIDPRTGQPFFNMVDQPAEDPPYVSPPVSDDEEEVYDPEAEYELDEHTMEIKKKGAAPKMKKFKRYPFLPSMLAGVGGPSGFDWLRPKECAIAHPEWFNTVKTREPGKITQLDMILNKAEKKRERYEALADGNSQSLRALELHEAIEKKEFMKAFAKMDAKTTNVPHPETGRYAIHCCVDTKQKELLEMVIAAKADVNTQDNFGQTALMLAAQQGSKELCNILLDAGADPVAEDSLGRSAADRVKVLPLDEEEHPFQNWREQLNGEPIPEDPAKASHELKSLISDKEKPKKQGHLLLRAIAQKDFRTASSAVDAKADLTLTDEAQNTALLLLAKTSCKNQEGIQVRLAEKIIKAGGDVNARNGQGNTALLYAAYRGNKQLLDALLSLKANVDLKNNEENTALMYAAHGGHEAICTALLDAFAKPAEKNKFGLTADKMALKRGFRNCAVLVQAYELAPKKPGEDDSPKKKEKAKENNLSFDYSKWNELEREMEKDAEMEDNVRRKEAYAANKKPQPKLEDFGPEAFGLPPDTPWPPQDPSSKDSFDYSRWDKIVDDIERKDEVMERFEYLQANPQYEWKNGSKMRVLY